MQRGHGQRAADRRRTQAYAEIAPVGCEFRETGLRSSPKRCLPPLGDMTGGTPGYIGQCCHPLSGSFIKRTFIGRLDFQSSNVYVAESNSVKNVREFLRANKLSASIWNSRADRRNRPQR
jgi:hypothetical protein